MHRVHRSYKYMVHRIDWVVVGEGNSCVKKEESAAAE
jgi:hypothetical protein